MINPTRDPGPGGLAASMAAGAFALALITTPMPAQIGAIGVVPGGTASGADALAGTPVFTNSALTLPRGRWGFSGLVGLTRQSTDLFDPQLGDEFTRTFTNTSFFAMGAYAVHDRALVGVMVPPVTRRELKDEYQGDTFTESETGAGDPILFGKYQLARSGDGRTALAGVASVSLPLGKSGFGSEGARVGLGAVASRQVNKITLHAEAGVGIPTHDADGETAVGLNAAGVFAVSPRIWVNGELLTTISAGEYTTLAAPSVRFALGRMAFLDVGFAFKALSSIEGYQPITALAGLVLVP